MKRYILLALLLLTPTLTYAQWNSLGAVGPGNPMSSDFDAGGYDITNILQLELNGLTVDWNNIGENSLFMTPTPPDAAGTHNIVIGSPSAGEDMTSAANSNTLIGRNVGNSITTGGQNTIIGTNSGKKLTTSSGNVCIGNGACQDQAVDANDNIMIGSMTGDGYNSQLDSYLIIGDQSNFSSDPIIVGDMSAQTLILSADTTVTGTFTFAVAPTTGGTNIEQTAGGQLVRPVSSKKHKHDIEDYTLDVDAAMKLRVVSFKWNYDNTDSQGLIAEEVYELIPEVVTLDKNGEPESVHYGRLSALMISGFQQQQKELITLQEEIAELRGIINEL